MYPPLSLMQTFYDRRLGAQVRRLMQRRMHRLWPDLSGQAVLVVGHAAPLAPTMLREAERLIALIPQDWPVEAVAGPRGNVAIHSREDEIPLPDSCMDAALVVHCLEYADSRNRLLREVWRVLRPNGRLLMIVPNRTSLWSLFTHTPFGHGVPYTLGQAISLLEGNMFTIEETTRAIYIPPLSLPWPRRVLVTVERLGRRLMPMLAGLNLVGARKTLMGGTPLPVTQRLGRALPETVLTGARSGPQSTLAETTGHLTASRGQESRSRE